MRPSSGPMLLVLALGSVALQPASAAPGRRCLDGAWELQSSVLVPEGGAVVSSESFRPDGWHRTSVPSTALGVLVRAGIYPDPRIGLDAFRIPDSSDEFNAAHDLARFSHLPESRNPWRDPYWYRTIFELQEKSKGERTWLELLSVNYRADVWLNGSLVADSREVVGMFRRFRFDVSELVRQGRNVLALRIHPVDHPGTPDAQLEVFGKERGYRKEILKDVTEVMTIGYDCMPTVPDRNMGICQGVYIDTTGSVDLRHPFVATDLPLPATDRALLRVSAEAVNASDRTVLGSLRGEVVGTSLRFEEAVELSAGETKRVEVLPWPVLEEPRLWWPSGYGEPNLYAVRLEFVEDDVVLDSEVVTFGVREIDTVLHEVRGAHGRQVLINGERIFCRGGYIQPELLLQWDRRRMETEIRYYTEAHLNLVYFEDIPNPPDELLDLCDQYGLLFGSCFYGCYWMLPGSGYPEDIGLLEECTIDLLRRYRNHPSLVLYMAMNEGDTREDVYSMWRRHVLDLDGTRFFIPSGTFPPGRENVPEWIRPDCPVGMTDAGTSYTWQEPDTYFRWVRERPNWMFMMEAGSASLPPIESLARFLPDLGSREGDGPFPLTEAWAHHGANHYYRDYDRAIRRLLGEPETVADYCWRGHVVTADQHRALFEAVHHRMWTTTSGFTQWKINACWPSVQWQIFDAYLRPMVSYYFIRNACEPLHVQWNRSDDTVAVVHHGREARSGLRARARILDLEGRLLHSRVDEIDVPANGYRDAFRLNWPPADAGVQFLRLDLMDSSGESLSRNLYWVSRSEDGSLRALDNLPVVRLEASLLGSTLQGDGWHHRVRVTNPSMHVAFFVQLALTERVGGDEILPAYWSDNYLTLLPGEVRELTVATLTRSSDSAGLVLEVGGWNVHGTWRCESLEASRTSARIGEDVEVTASVTNTFLQGSRVVLEIDDRSIASRFAWGRNGRRDTLTFPVAVTNPGTHRVRVGDRTLQLEIR